LWVIGALYVFYLIGGQTQHLTYLAYYRASLKGYEATHQSRIGKGFKDISRYILTISPAKIDVKIRRRRTAWVYESLEVEV
jgi:hypothetical protein